MEQVRGLFDSHHRSERAALGKDVEAKGVHPLGAG